MSQELHDEPECEMCFNPALPGKELCQECIDEVNNDPDDGFVGSDYNAPSESFDSELE